MSRLDEILGVTTPTTTAAPTTSSATAASSTQSQFISNLFSQLVQTTRQANALPDVDEFKFLTTTSPEFVTQSTKVQGQLLNLLGLISDAITHKTEASLEKNKRSSGVVASATYSSKKDTLDRFHQLSDTVDTALEAVDLCLDEHRGVKRGNTALSGGSDASRLLRGASQFSSSLTMQKPQRHFAHLIDNSTRTWIPILPSKPNALKPLANYEKLRKEHEEKLAAAATSKKNNSDAMDDDSPLYPHPYKYEIENLDYAAIRSKQLIPCKEQLYDTLQKVPCKWIDNSDDLKELVQELDGVNEIAIDLEHHSMRSYLGITCLMQISTRKKDYLIDTLKLRTELHRLNSSFTNPAIVKVLHGSDSDIIWLQRDLGLYIVNLFDTGQAARVLDFQSAGLAYLLKHFCDVIADKKFQRADWRIRPLSAEMLLYARMDTHYLLYIYDRLKNELIQRSTPQQNQMSPIQGVAGLLAQTLERSKAISLKTFEKEDLRSTHTNPIPIQIQEFSVKEANHVLGKDVLSRVLIALYRLRDELARQEDESPVYLCSNPNLVQISQTMPVDHQQLEACCIKPIPHMVRQFSSQILNAIQEAKGSSSVGGITSSPLLGSSSGGDLPTLDLSSIQTPQNNKTKSALTSQLASMAAASSSSAAASAHHPSMMTPATLTSTMFAGLSTSTPQHSSTGWVQAIQDAAPSSSLLSTSHPSPVMSTEQLYSSANWIQASKNLAQNLAQVKNVHPAPSSTTGFAMALFDDSGSDQASSQAQQPHSSPVRATNFTSISMSPSPKSSPFSILASSTESRDAEINRSVMEQAHAALTTAATYTHAISALSASTPMKSTLPETTAAQMEIDDDSAMLRTPNTGEPIHSFVSPSPMSLQVIPSPVNVPSTSVPAGFTSIAGEVAPQPVESSISNLVPSDSPLPKSMREIYKISNENRRKKKKVKTSASGIQSAQNSGMDGDEEETNSANASANNSRPSSSAGMRKPDGKSSKGHSTNSSMDAESSNSQEFMKTIGWASSNHNSTSNAAIQLLNNQQQHQQQPNSAHSFADRKRKHSSAPPSGNVSLSSSPPSTTSAAFALPSYDYSHASLPPSNPAAQAYFNPYNDMGRDKMELKAQAGTAGPVTAANKIYKGQTQLKSQNKSVTVRMDDSFNQQRQRGGSAGSALPPPKANQQYQRR